MGQVLAGLSVFVGMALAGADRACGAPKVEEGPFGDFFGEPPSREQLLEQLQPVAGKAAEIHANQKWRRRMICGVQGSFRFSGQWAENMALRLSLVEPKHLQLHFWNGNLGVSLCYYPEYHRSWAAYGALREEDPARRQTGEPARLALWATDEGRYQRCGTGTFEVHYTCGRIVLMRGDVMLLTVPLERPPQEVFWQGSAKVRGLAMVASRGVPPPATERPAFLRTGHPAELPWETSLVDGAELRRLPDGKLELSAPEKAERPSQVWTTVRRPGLYEYIFQVENPSVGSGVYLADAEGKPVWRVGFFDHRATKQTVFDLLPPWSNDTEKGYNHRQQPVPLASQRQWLRVVLGAGVCKLWTSGDAVHWSQIAARSDGAAGACWNVGLYGLPGRTARSIRLNWLEVRQLDGLASIVPESLQQQVGKLVDTDNLESWEKEVRDARPQGVGADQWRRACILRTLSHSSKNALQQTLLDRLQQQVFAEPGRPADLLAFFNESALLRSSEDWNAVDRLLLHAERLGLALTGQGEETPHSRVSDLMLRLSFWSPRRLPAFSEKLLRQELVTLVGAGRVAEVRELCRRLRYWRRTDPPEPDQPPWSREVQHLVAWASQQSSAGQNEEDDDPRSEGPVIAWRHPYVERLSREGYNVLAELQAALDGGSLREACQIIAASSRHEGLGLLPDKKDPWHLVSLNVAVEAAMRQNPALIKAMLDQYGPLGQLRLKQAVAAGDAAAVESVAMQFFGTPSAAAASRWLGDRALAAGRFAEAAHRYRGGMSTIAAEDRPALEAHLRLAGAMAGQDLGKPPAEAVQFGRHRLSPAQFEQLVRQLRSARSGQTASQASNPIAPGRYEARPWAYLDGQQVQRPGVLPDRGIDWAGRQTAVLVTPRQMIVSNRVQQVAFELPTGRQQWSQRRTPEPRDQQWALIPMQPIGLAGRILLRRLGDEGPELACLEATDGRLLWSYKPAGHVASDPFLLDNEPYVLTASSVQAGGDLGLALVGLHVESGQVRVQTPLVEFRDYWRRQMPCVATAAGHRLIVAAAGTIFACDAAGRMHWLRRQVFVPPPGQDYWIARPWYEQWQDPPLVYETRVYATQPGVWGIDCLDLETGRLDWSRPLGGLSRMLGLADGRLIVEAGDQVLALDGATGKAVWCIDLPGRLDTRLVGQPAALMAVQAEVKEGGKPPLLALASVRLADGRILARNPLAAPAKPDALIRPLMLETPRPLIFLGSAQDGARREILELVRIGDLELAQRLAESGR